MTEIKFPPENPLGIVAMPPGYELIKLDSGHWMWATYTEESATDVDRWSVYRGAMAHFNRKGNGKNEGR